MDRVLFYDFATARRRRYANAVVNHATENTHGVYVCRAREYACLSSDRWRLLSEFGIPPRRRGRMGTRVGERVRMNGKKEGGRGDAATFESARQPMHFADSRKELAKYWVTTRDDTTPLDGHVVQSILPYETTRASVTRL